MDFSTVKSLQIPEGNVVSIADKDGNTLWANVNKYAYGIRWDSDVPASEATTKCERIGNLELHKTLPIQSKFACCVHQEGDIKYWLNPDDSRFKKLSRTDITTDVISCTNFININKPDTEVFSTYNIGTIDNCRTPSGHIDFTISFDESKMDEDDLTYLDTLEQINIATGTYKYLYMWMKLVYSVSSSNNGKISSAGDDKTIIVRVEHVDTDKKLLYVSFVDTSDEDKEAFLAAWLSDGTSTQGLGNITPSPSPSKYFDIEFGASLNGYDGEVGVYTPKFYIWSKDNEGAGNEVWMSEHKCVDYAREVKPHIIGIGKCPLFIQGFSSSEAKKWGYLGQRSTPEALDVITYSSNFAAGDGKDSNGNDIGKESLGIDNFRANYCKGYSKVLTMDHPRAWVGGTKGSILYYQIWSAIVWCYIVEYADFDIRKDYNVELTSDGYHQGGLGKGASGIEYLEDYLLDDFAPFVTNDFTLQLGNNSGVVEKKAPTYRLDTISVDDWSFSYEVNSSNTYTINRSNKLSITITKIVNLNMASADPGRVSGVQKYTITGITGTDQNIVFIGREGQEQLTITSDGTYDIDWGHNDAVRKINFTALQDSCNITITMAAADATYYNKSVPSIKVPHYRGFNNFWYGDAPIIIENLLTKRDYSNYSSIFYYTDKLRNFSSVLEDKEHVISKKLDSGGIKELSIDKKADIIPKENYYVNKYKPGYYYTPKGTVGVATVYDGKDEHRGSNVGSLISMSSTPVDAMANTCFVKCFILDK